RTPSRSFVMPTSSEQNAAFEGGPGRYFDDLADDPRPLAFSIQHGDSPVSSSRLDDDEEPHAEVEHPPHFALVDRPAPGEDVENRRPQVACKVDARAERVGKRARKISGDPSSGHVSYGANGELGFEQSRNRASVNARGREKDLA